MTETEANRQSAQIQIRAARTLDELRPLVALQQAYWGDDSESVIPAHMLFSLANNGGHVLTAYDADQPVGMLVGFLGTNMDDERRPAMANLQIVSKRMVVLSDYRSSGIGYRLKLAQRDQAMAQGVRLIVWTFDPLLSRNAHLNIRKLGAISRTYMPNYYGTADAGGLAVLGSSDRLAVEWWVTNRRVEERLFGTRRDLTLDQYMSAGTPILNPTTQAGAFAHPQDAVSLPPQTSLALLEIPLDYDDMIAADPDLARAWRDHTRGLLRQMFNFGFVVTDFLRDQLDGRARGFYLFSYDGPQYETLTNYVN